MACLASRIPYGDQITEKKLREIEVAEGIIKNLGFSLYRVRHYGDTARIEVVAEDFKRILSEDVRMKILKEFKQIGFIYISVDLAGYSQGSMNKSI